MLHSIFRAAWSRNWFYASVVAGSVMVVLALFHSAAGAVILSYGFEPTSTYTTGDTRATLKIYPGGSGINPSKVIWQNPSGVAVTYCPMGVCGSLYEQSVATNGTLNWRAFYFYIAGQGRSTGTYTAIIYERKLVGGLYVEVEYARANFTINGSTPPTATPVGGPTATPTPPPAPTPVPVGKLDATFGVSGVVTTGFSQNHDRINDMAVQTDTKIVAVGHTYDTASDYATFALARYNADGSLDSTFGNAGKVTTEFTGVWNEEAFAIAIQPDKNIVAAGTSSGQIVLARYDEQGNLDSTFGSGGKVVNPASGTAKAAAIDKNGKVVIAGDDYQDIKVMRFLSNGTLDTTFGTNGIAILSLGGYSAYANGMALQPDGKIVVAGSFTATSSGNSDAVVARFLADGSLDTNFGTGGKSLLDIYEDDVAYKVAMGPGNKIVLAGTSSAWLGNSYFMAARYNPDGSLDPVFGSGGTVISRIDDVDSSAYAMTILQDGRIVLAGESYCQTACGGVIFDLAMAVFTPDGILDTSSGLTTGIVRYHDGTGKAVLQQGNKIVVAGTNTNEDFLILRYNLYHFTRVYVPAVLK